MFFQLVLLRLGDGGGGVGDRDHPAICELLLDHKAISVVSDLQEVPGRGKGEAIVSSSGNIRGKHGEVLPRGVFLLGNGERIACQKNCQPGFFWC